MIRCIAIDDEPLALRKLGEYIKKTPFLPWKIRVPRHWKRCKSYLKKR